MSKTKFAILLSILISLLYIPVQKAYSQSSAVQIEVFDTEKGRVIQKSDNGTKIQEEMKTWINYLGKTNTFGLNSSINYYLIKVPLISPLDIKLDYVMHGSINEIILIIKKDKALEEKHNLLLLDEENKPIIVELNKDIKPFLKQINFSLK
jgi:uncharacterized FlaG/YvyC family protein